MAVLDFLKTLISLRTDMRLSFTEIRHWRKERTIVTAVAIYRVVINFGVDSLLCSIFRLISKNHWATLYSMLELWRLYLLCILIFHGICLSRRLKLSGWTTEKEAFTSTHDLNWRLAQTRSKRFFTAQPGLSTLALNVAICFLETINR